MLTRMIKSQFNWKRKIIEQDQRKVEYWELFQKLPNGIVITLAQVGPLLDRCIEAHGAGLHFQSQITCKVENPPKLECTETLEGSIGRLNTYFGICDN